EPIKNVSAQDDDLRVQLKKMEEMMQKQQGMINNLKTKIEMQEDISKSYVTSIDEREIGNVMEEYLQKAEGQGLLEKYLGPCELGYKKGFYFRTRDDKFFMRMTGRIQMRYGYEDRDNELGEEDDSSFRLRRARLKWDGYAYKDFIYKIELALKSQDTKPTSTADKDKAKAVELIDWWAEYKKYPFAKIRFGQWKVPFNHQRVGSSSTLQRIDRASAQDEFTMGRQIGAMVSGNLFDNKMEYYAGMFNGNGRNEARNGNNEHLYIARVSWNPFGGFGKGIGEQISDLAWSEKPKAHLSAAIAFDNAADETIDLEGLGETTSDDVDRTSLVGEYGLKYKGFSTSAEFYWRKYDNVGGKSLIDRGFFVQAGYFLIPKHLEIAGRYSLVDYDNRRTTDAVREATAGINYFFAGQSKKLQFNFVRMDNELPHSVSVSDDIDYFYRLQFQLAF
ncbi:MAG: porin, partial [Planctomycetota bacterium]